MAPLSKDEAWFRILRPYFAFVWPPFLIYLGLYALAWVSHFPIGPLTTIFQILHCINLLLLVLFAREGYGRGKVQRAHVLFWSALVILFLLPSAYLEYPSDPWEHFRRILSWQSSAEIPDNEIKNRFAYYFNWTLLSWANISERRAALCGVAAFWQLILAAQFCLLLKALRLDTRTQWIGVLSYLCFFGTSLFGIRYYALSSTPLAMIGLYGALAYLIGAIESGAGKLITKVAVLTSLIGLMELNHHRQELVNFAIAGGSLMAVEYWLRRNVAERAYLGKILLWITAVGFSAGLLFHFFGTAQYLALKKTHDIALWGGISPLSDALRIRSTLGLPGMLGLIASFLLFRTHPRLSALAAAPTALLVFPPTSRLLLSATGSDSGIYRLLYGFPASVAFGLGLYKTLEKAKPKMALPLAALALISMGLVYGGPVHGRLFFQLYPHDPRLALVPLDTTAEWFKEHRKSQVEKPKCQILADDVTYFALAAHFGLPLYGHSRLNPIRELIVLSETREPVENLVERKICGVLVPDRSKSPIFPDSPIGRISGHWRSNLIDFRYFLPENEMRLIAKLEEGGWLPTEVPPFYQYWEPDPKMQIP